MKKFAALLLVMTLLLTGCDISLSDIELFSTKAESETETEIYTQPTTAPVVEPGPFRLGESKGPLYDGVVKYAGTLFYFVVNVPAEAEDRYITVTSSDETVIAFRRNHAYANKTDVCVEFCQAGEAALTFTLEGSGETKTYHITVKEDYDCNPGPGELTPQQFVDCFRKVVQANGMTLMEHTTNCYSISMLDDYELTWEWARTMAEGKCANAWRDGWSYVYFTYAGVKPAGHAFYCYLDN